MGYPLATGEPVEPFLRHYDVTEFQTIIRSVVAVDADGAVIGAAATTFEDWNRRTILQAIYVD